MQIAIKQTTAQSLLFIIPLLLVAECPFVPIVSALSLAAPYRLVH